MTATPVLARAVSGSADHRKLRSPRESADETGSLTGPGALAPELASVCLDECACDRESDPAAAAVTAACRVDAVEAFEHAVEIVGRKPFAGVGL